MRNLRCPDAPEQSRTRGMGVWAHTLCKVLCIQNFQVFGAFRNGQSPQIPTEIFRWKKKYQVTQENGNPEWTIRWCIHFKAGFVVKKKLVWSHPFFIPLSILSKWCSVAPLACTYPSSWPNLGDASPRKTLESAEHKMVLLRLQHPGYTVLPLSHKKKKWFALTSKNTEANNCCLIPTIQGFPIFFPQKKIFSVYHIRHATETNSIFFFFFTILFKKYLHD